jgi:hypothetical protein
MPALLNMYMGASYVLQILLTCAYWEFILTMPARASIPTYLRLWLGLLRKVDTLSAAAWRATTSISDYAVSCHVVSCHAGSCNKVQAPLTHRLNSPIARSWGFGKIVVMVLTHSYTIALPIMCVLLARLSVWTRVTGFKAWSLWP